MVGAPLRLEMPGGRMLIYRGGSGIRQPTGLPTSVNTRITASGGLTARISSPKVVMVQQR
jgi:hypothetical protein